MNSFSKALRSLTAVVCLSIVAVGFPVSARAQSQATTGEINGRVVDAQGAAMPGVNVTAKSPQTGYVRSVVTDGEGLYALPLMPPDRYDVTYELAGFGVVTRPIVLTVGSTLTANQTLQISSVAETLTVTAASPLIESSATIRTTTVDSEAIRNLPINGRRFQDFATLTPTVQIDTQRGQLSFAGQRGINANVSIDGADYNQPFFGGIRGGERSNNAFTVPQEAIQEFQVVAAGYSAEFGRSTGGLMNAITKSGTNTVRGTAFYVNRNRDWAEKNAFDQNAAPTQQQFGASFGGPVTKDRLFYFGSLEMQKFKNTRAVLFNLTGISKTSDNGEAFDYYKSLETPFDTTNDAVGLLGRLDYQFAGGKRFSVRYSFSDNNAKNANATGNALADTTTSALSNNGTEKDQTNTVVGQYTAALKSNILFETRGQFSREERPRDANEKTPLVTDAVGNYGTVSFLGENIQRDWRAQIAANLTGVLGRHTVKTGIEYNHVDAFQKFGFNQFGTWNLSGTATNALEILTVGGPTANRFDATAATYSKQLGNLELALATDEIALFAQDTWKLRPSFTLNYGLRWEGALNPTPQLGNDFLVNAVTSATFPLGRSVDPSQIPNQLSQFGPRVGFAWDPNTNGKTVVRGFTGIYYARTPMLIWAAPMNNFRIPAGDLSVGLPFTPPAGNPNNTLYKQLALIGIDLNTRPLNNLPILTTDQLTQIATALGLASPNPFLNAQPIAVDKDYKNPRAFQGGAGAERELVPGIIVAADVTYVKTENLQRNRELNLGVPAPRPTDPAQRPFFPTTRPQPLLRSLQLRESTAESEYTALTLTNRVRKPWGETSVNYVLSKSMSDDDNERDAGGTQFENTYDLSTEWGPARLDRRHQFNGYVLFFLPYGLDVSTGFRFLSALPIDATMGRDANNSTVASTGGADRPFSGPGRPFQRNGFRNEPFKEVNLRLQWGPQLASSRRVLLTAEFFNIFNWDNIQLSGTAVTNYCTGTAPDDCGFGAPTNLNFLSLTDNVPTSTTFGQLIRTNNPGAPRQIQLGVRFEF